MASPALRSARATRPMMLNTLPSVPLSRTAGLVVIASAPLGRRAGLSSPRRGFSIVRPSTIGFRQDHGAPPWLAQAWASLEYRKPRLSRRKPKTLGTLLTTHPAASIAPTAAGGCLARPSGHGRARPGPEKAGSGPEVQVGPPPRV